MTATAGKSCSNASKELRSKRGSGADFIPAILIKKLKIAGIFSKQNAPILG
jgi:hypothetical protein